MMIADNAAFAVGPAAGENRIGPVRRNFAEDEGKPNTEGRVARWIRRIFFQECSRFGDGQRRAIFLKGPSALVIVLPVRARTKVQPIMIHSALLGSVERFLGVYIEHTGGRFPIWLAPEQLRVIQVKDSPEIDKFVDEIATYARENGIRTHIDRSNESVGKKIRNSELMKVPYTVVVGEKELDTKQLTPRVRTDLAVENRQEASYEVESFINSIVHEAKGRVQKSSL